jgi:hypothetical protein
MKSTEEQLYAAVNLIAGACINNVAMHVTKSFKDSPDGHAAVVASFVSLPDPLARDLHKRLDETIGTFLSENGIVAAERPS